MRTTILLIVIALITSACGRANANSARAEVVPAPLPGYTCFVVYNADGVAVGGNCLKSE
jgi:hypothetical protein